MIHADEYRQIRSALDWAEDRQYPIILAGGRDSWRLAESLVDRKIPVVFEHVFTLPPRKVDPYDVHYRAPAVLHQAGVKVAFSLGLGGFSASMLRNLPYQAAQAAAFGLPEEEALKNVLIERSQNR
jgi:imidazolonepropionase-like amidohydrolase